MHRFLSSLLILILRRAIRRPHQAATSETDGHPRILIHLRAENLDRQVTHNTGPGAVGRLISGPGGVPGTAHMNTSKSRWNWSLNTSALFSRRISPQDCWDARRCVPRKSPSLERAISFFPKTQSSCVTQKVVRIANHHLSRLDQAAQERPPAYPPGRTAICLRKQSGMGTRRHVSCNQERWGTTMHLRATIQGASGQQWRTTCSVREFQQSP